MEEKPEETAVNADIADRADGGNPKFLNVANAKAELFVALRHIIQYEVQQQLKNMLSENPLTEEFLGSSEFMISVQSLIEDYNYVEPEEVTTYVELQSLVDEIDFETEVNTVLENGNYILRSV